MHRKSKIRKRPVYKCTVCNREVAVLRYLFVTRTKKFRAKFHCPICKINFEVTIGGKNWTKSNYPTSEIYEKISEYITQLVLEGKLIQLSV